MMMRWVAMIWALVVGLLLASCAGGDGATAQPGVAQVTIVDGDRAHRFTVEVARTAEEQRQGLMFRTDLADDAGMIFPFSQPKIASFWMQNTLIPLDILFIRADGSIDRIAENTVPESREPVASGGEVVAVLELKGGTAARLDIDESATVRWRAVEE